MSEKEKNLTLPKQAKPEKREKTPPMFGTPVFQKDKSDSLSLAVLKHLGEKPEDEHASMVEELRNEVAADGGEFLPEEPEEQKPRAKPSDSARTCLPPEPPINEEHVPEPEFGRIFDEETIGEAVIKEIEKRGENEIAEAEISGKTDEGEEFRIAPDGDRIRHVMPDQNDPKRAGILTRLVLAFAGLMDKYRGNKK